MARIAATFAATPHVDGIEALRLLIVCVCAIALAAAGQPQPF